jgi:hypothetical protein
LKRNIITMKRKLLFGASFLFIAWAATSCTALSDCKFCKLQTTDSSTGEITDGNETEYCGATLVAIEAQTPKTTGTLTTKYVCR